MERVSSLKCSLFCVYWGYQSVWKMCGKGIIFIDTFHTITLKKKWSQNGSTLEPFWKTVVLKRYLNGGHPVDMKTAPPFFQWRVLSNLAGRAGYATFPSNLVVEIANVKLYFLPYIFLYTLFQDEKNQVLVTNVWLEHVSQSLFYF